MLNEETKQKLILNLLGIDGEKTTSTPKVNSNPSFYEVGKVYVVRTVTMIYLGELKSEGSDHLILTNCAWIPDTSRWNEFLKGEAPNEMEPYVNDVIVYKGAMLDCTEIKEKIEIKVI